MRIRVAGAQIAVTRDVASNVAAISHGIDFAAGEGADVLLTPEGSLSGYTHGFDPQEVRGALAEVTTRARDAGVALALGTCFVEPDGECYNQLRFYGAAGEVLGFHAKTLLCSTLGARPTGEIDHYATAPLRTFSLKGVTVGGLICNDMWASPMCTSMPDPHLSGLLAAAGARIIFHAVNGGRRGDLPRLDWDYHEANLRIRAIAGRVWIVTADSCHPVDIPCSAPSGVVSPQGKWLCRTEPSGEQFFAHTIELPDV